ncbi:hypothetical protein BHE74_00048854 [Ensete ventricosum]|nr:hypothetical protein BHE74_00048854 [Ensete ventricosum]
MPPLLLPPFLEVHAAAQAFLGVFAVKRVMGRWGTEASCREAAIGVMEVGGSTPAGDNEAMNDSMNRWLGGRWTAPPPRLRDGERRRHGRSRDGDVVSARQEHLVHTNLRRL